MPEPMTPEHLDLLAETDPLRLRDEAVALLARVEKLEEGAAKLRALEAAGVDNWDGYSYALEILNEETDRA